MAAVFLETFQGQKMYFLYALEQNQKALKYFHTNSIEPKPPLLAQKGQVPIFLPSERLILPKENWIKINICKTWISAEMLLLTPHQSAQPADPFTPGKHGKASVASSKPTEQGRGDARIPFQITNPVSLAVTLWLSLLLISIGLMFSLIPSKMD